MAVEKLKPDAQAASTAIRPRSETSFPAYNLGDSLEVANLIHKRGGGTASAEHLSSYLGYKSTNNGAYLARVGAARAFGFIAKNGNVFAPTPLAMQVLSPVYEVDRKKAVVEAFFNVAFFKRVYEDFRGKELPPGFGMKNALRNQYGIVPSRVDVAYKVLMDSAEQAGFFATRMGAKTHLIIPAFQAATPQAAMQEQTSDEGASSMVGGGNGGGGTGDGPADESKERPSGRAQPSTNSRGAQLSEVKAQYLSTLIKLFEEKSSKGDLDEKLMERIERLLGA